MRFSRIFALQLSLSALVFPAATIDSAGADDQHPQKWALLVGINDYAHFRDLRYASRDMVSLGSALINRGFAPDHVFVFHDDTRNSNFRPLKANIERQLIQLTQSVQKGDILIFGFSGHGLIIGGKTYLCPFEAREDNPAATMLAVEDIVAQLQSSHATSRLLIADACRNNRRSTQSQQRSTNPPAVLSRLGAALDSPTSDVAVLWSCGPEQTSYEEDRFQHGVFSHYILSGLAGHADGNRDGNVSLNELHQFTRHHTSAHVTKTWNDAQTPQKLGRNDETWSFARISATSGAIGASTPPPIAPPAASTTPPATTSKKWLTNSLGMTLMLVPAGEFLMGSPPSEINRATDEPQHLVQITHPFYLGMCEVTQAQYRAVMDANPSWFSATGGGKARVTGMSTDSFPVESVSWNDAIEFCQRLSAQEGRVYRLPTEAEWEYACRAGSSISFTTGNTEADLARVGWYGANLIPAGNSGRRTNPVGRKQPNAFNLYDMHGNVWEWCADYYDRDYDSDSPAVDPTGPSTGLSRVLRGGDWLRGPRLCRSAYRGHLPPDHHQYSIGFRICLPSTSIP